MYTYNYIYHKLHTDIKILQASILFWVNLNSLHVIIPRIYDNIFLCRNIRTCDRYAVQCLLL